MATRASVSSDRPVALAGLRDWRSAVALFAAAFAALLAFSPELFNDGDTYWHVAAGQLMIDTLRCPRAIRSHGLSAASHGLRTSGSPKCSRQPPTGSVRGPRLPRCTVPRSG